MVRIRVVTDPAEPDRCRTEPVELDGPAGFRRSKEISKLTRGPPQGQVKNVL